jgi:pimeloyl-ACP methyl ester carboxylesterase
MLVDLVSVTCRDGVRLDGIRQAPPSPGSGPLDAAVCVHGTGSNFYGSTLFDAVAAKLLQMNVAVVRVNTRGHDFPLNVITDTSGGTRRLKVASEVLDHCRHDLAAWVAWAKANCGPRVGLIGHSSGALKCLYAMAHEPDDAVTHLVAVSPPCLSHSRLAASQDGHDFVETFQRASALVQVGEPDELLVVRQPLPLVTTAAGYVEKYGPDERYNYLKFIGKVRCRVLLTLGEIEAKNHAPFRGAGEAVKEAAPAVDVVTVAGADHFYGGDARGRLLECVADWLNKNQGG